MTNNFLTVKVNKYAGGQTFSVELLDRSNPVFFDELVRQMEYAYALATDKFVAGQLLGNGQIAATAADNTAAGILTFVSEAAAEVYKDSLGFARNLIVTPEQWAKIMSYNDSGRPIYTASQPQNAAGVAVDEYSIIGLPAFYRATQILGGVIASLPFDIIEKGFKGTSWLSETVLVPFIIFQLTYKLHLLKLKHPLLIYRINTIRLVLIV